MHSDATDHETLAARVTRLEDLDLIRELWVTYGDRLDRFYSGDANAESVVDLFTHDADFDGGRSGSARGGEAIERLLRSNGAARSLGLHHYSGHSVDLRPGADTASGWVYLLSMSTVSGQAMIAAGREFADFRKEDGRWRFSRLSAALEFRCPIKQGWVPTPFWDAVALTKLSAATRMTTKDGR